MATGLATFSLRNEYMQEARASTVSGLNSPTDMYEGDGERRNSEKETVVIPVLATTDGVNEIGHFPHYYW
jgi:hypothetical protein